MDTTALSTLETIISDMTTSLSSGDIDDIREKHLERLNEALDTYIATYGDSLSETARVQIEQAAVDIDQAAEAADVTTMINALDHLTQELEQPLLNI